jgi:hypothetical protein
MSSQIRYQFLHSRDTQLVRFDGGTLAVEALKKEIAAQNGLYSALDLVVTDTGGVPFPPGAPVHKNSSVLVRSKAPVGPAIVVGVAEGSGAAGGGSAIPGLGGSGGSGAMHRCVAGHALAQGGGNELFYCATPATIYQTSSLDPPSAHTCLAISPLLSTHSPPSPPHTAFLPPPPLPSSSCLQRRRAFSLPCPRVAPLRSSLPLPWGGAWQQWLQLLLPPCPPSPPCQGWALLLLLLLLLLPPCPPCCLPSPCPPLPLPWWACPTWWASPWLQWGMGMAQLLLLLLLLLQLPLARAGRPPPSACWPCAPSQ